MQGKPLGTEHWVIVFSSVWPNSGQNPSAAFPALLPVEWQLCLLCLSHIQHLLLSCLVLPLRSNLHHSSCFGLLTFCGLYYPLSIVVLSLLYLWHSKHVRSTVHFPAVMTFIVLFDVEPVSVCLKTSVSGDQLCKVVGDLSLLSCSP